MQYLGTYKICPNYKDIEVECYGTSYPYEAQTLEHQGCPKHAEIEQVKHGDIDITDYLSDNILDELNVKVNSK